MWARYNRIKPGGEVHSSIKNIDLRVIPSKLRISVRWRKRWW